MKVRPIGDRVVVQPIPEPDRTEGGLFKPETAQEDRPTRGTVVAVGTKAKDVSEGDEVVFTKYGGSEIVVDGETCLVIDVKDLLGVVEA